jgi:hypothetical protein
MGDGSSNDLPIFRVAATTLLNVSAPSIKRAKLILEADPDLAIQVETWRGQFDCLLAPISRIPR